MELLTLLVVAFTIVGVLAVIVESAGRLATSRAIARLDARERALRANQERYARGERILIG